MDSKVELHVPGDQYAIFEKEAIPAVVLKTSFHHEYSDTKLTVVFVDRLEDAISHINTHGSGHTESIITEVTY